jgi:hypothetical protein
MEPMEMGFVNEGLALPKRLFNLTHLSPPLPKPETVTLQSLWARLEVLSAPKVGPDFSTYE